MSHNDAQELNILTSIENSENFTLIDFEYGGWNPMSYDLGNYLCECAIDNSYSKGFGIKLYLSNLPSKEERLNFLTIYLKHYF